MSFQYACKGLSSPANRLVPNHPGTTAADSVADSGIGETNRDCVTITCVLLARMLGTPV